MSQKSGDQCVAATGAVKCGILACMGDTAILSSIKDYTLFSFGGRELRFRAPRALKRYLQVNKWDAGSIEVETEYEDGVEEEYIDLAPILRDLYIDTESFLSPIKKVEVRYV